MTVVNKLVPALTILLLVLLAVLPWGFPSSSRFVLPFLPCIAIHFWVASHDDALPEWVVFAAGLSVDVLTNGPLGYWSFIYLLTFALALQSRHLPGGGAGLHWLTFVTGLAITVITAWALSSLYFLEFADWQAFAVAAMAAGIAYPIVALVLRALDSLVPDRLDHRLERGA